MRAFLEIIRLVFVCGVWAIWFYISINIAIESKRTDGKPFIVVNTYSGVAPSHSDKGKG